MIGAVPATGAGAAADKQRNEWTAPEKSAIRRYAKEKMRPWDEVTYKEVAASQGGIAAWQKKVGKELTPAQKKFWAEQDETQKAAHGQDQGTTKPKPKPMAQARPAAAKRTNAQELVDTTESDTDDEDFWTVQYPVTVLEEPVGRRKQAAAVELRQALETADKLVTDEGDGVALKRSAAAGLLQALEAADAQIQWVEYCSSVDQEWGEGGCSGEEMCLEGLCHECCDRSRCTCWESEPEQEQYASVAAIRRSVSGGHQKTVSTGCAQRDCVVSCCDMGGCGCLERGRREQVQIQMRAAQDNDMSMSMSMSPVTEGSHPAEVSSGEESDSCGQGDRTVVTAPMVKSCSGTEHQEECSKCIMCAAQEVEQEFQQCGMCAVCAALSVQDMTPDKAAAVSPGLEVDAQARAGAKEDHWALIDGKLEEVPAGIQQIQIEIGDAAEFAANVTRPAPWSAEQQSRRRRPARKKHMVIESDTDEEEFCMHMRSAPHHA